MAKKAQRILDAVVDFFTRQFKEAVFTQEGDKLIWSANPDSHKALRVELMTVYNEKYKHNDFFVVVSMNDKEQKRLQIRNELPHARLSKLLSSLIMGRGVPGKKSSQQNVTLMKPQIVDRRQRCEECGKHLPDEELTIDDSKLMARTVCESCLKKIEGKK